MSIHISHQRQIEFIALGQAIVNKGSLEEVYLELVE